MFYSSVEHSLQLTNSHQCYHTKWHEWWFEARAQCQVPWEWWIWFCFWLPHLVSSMSKESRYQWGRCKAMLPSFDHPNYLPNHHLNRQWCLSRGVDLPLLWRLIPTVLFDIFVDLFWIVSHVFRGLSLVFSDYVLVFCNLGCDWNYDMVI